MIPLKFGKAHNYYFSLILSSSSIIISITNIVIENYSLCLFILEFRNNQVMESAFSNVMEK